MPDQSVLRIADQSAVLWADQSVSAVLWVDRSVLLTNPQEDSVQANKRKPDAASKVVRQSRTDSTVLDEDEDLEETSQKISQPRAKKAVSNSRLKRKVPEVDASSEESRDHNGYVEIFLCVMSSFCLCCRCSGSRITRKRPQPTYVYEVVPTASWVDSSQISDKSLIAGRRGRR